MLFQKILLIVIIAISILTGYSSYKFWNKKIDPRKSFKHFTIYMLANLASIFAVVFITSFIIIYFKEFFFKK
jgi:hypothetical protein